MRRRTRYQILTPEERGLRVDLLRAWSGLPFVEPALRRVLRIPVLVFTAKDRRTFVKWCRRALLPTIGVHTEEDDSCVPTSAAFLTE
jgi:hypothetical protein